MTGKKNEVFAESYIITNRHNSLAILELTEYDGDIPAFIPEKYFLNVNLEALQEFCLWMKSNFFLM